MAKKEFAYHGKTADELRVMDIKQFMELVPARQRRSLKRGFTYPQKSLLEKIRKNKKNMKTHSTDMIIVPQMIDRLILVFNGKEWTQVKILPEMLGHYLGEFVQTRKRVMHNAPGIGATRSSASVSVR